MRECVVVMGIQRIRLEMLNELYSKLPGHSSACYMRKKHEPPSHR